MTLTRQHFQLIADAIRVTNFTNPQDRIALASEFARKLADTNPNFDRTRFLTACGVGN